MTCVLMSVCLGLATVANASFVEIGNNNSISVPTPVPLGAAMPWSDVGVMTLESGTDVDFFSIALNAGQILAVSTTPMGIELVNGAFLFNNPDTLLGVYNTFKELIASDDNSFSPNSKGSLVQYKAPVAGTYYFAVTGAGDTDFDGKITPGGAGHGKTGSYMLTVSVIPEPATLAFMLLTGLGLLARRRK